MGAIVDLSREINVNAVFAATVLRWAADNIVEMIPRRRRREVASIVKNLESLYKSVEELASRVETYAEIIEGYATGSSCLCDGRDYERIAKVTTDIMMTVTSIVDKIRVMSAILIIIASRLPLKAWLLKRGEIHRYLYSPLLEAMYHVIVIMLVAAMLTSIMQLLATMRCSMSCTGMRG